MSWQQDVFSSMISSVAYDDATQEMTIAFKSGGAWTYSGVSEGLAQDLANAPSVGKMFLSEIKGRYPERRVG
jgi:KTSC domain